MADPKNPKLRGLIQKVALFHHAVDMDIEEAERHVEKAHERRKDVFKIVHEKIDERVADIGTALEGLDDLEKASNFPPLDGESKT